VRKDSQASHGQSHVLRGPYNVQCHEVVIDLEVLERAKQNPARGSVGRRYKLSVISLITNFGD